MGTSEHRVHGRCVAVDVHYPRSGGARAAAVVAADALFAQVLAEHTAVVPEVPRYQPGEFYRRELPGARGPGRYRRGTSAGPLFVTAAGMPRADAAELVRRMTGRFRVPDALRRADALARTGPPAALQGSRHPPHRRAERGMCARSLDTMPCMNIQRHAR